MIIFGVSIEPTLINSIIVKYTFATPLLPVFPISIVQRTGCMWFSTSIGMYIDVIALLFILFVLFFLWIITALLVFHLLVWIYVSGVFIVITRLEVINIEWLLWVGSYDRIVFFV